MKRELNDLLQRVNRIPDPGLSVLSDDELNEQIAWMEGGRKGPPPASYVPPKPGAPGLFSNLSDEQLEERIAQLEGRPVGTQHLDSRQHTDMGVKI